MLFDNIRFLLYFEQNKQVLRKVRQATLLIISATGRTVIQALAMLSIPMLSLLR